MMKRKYSTFTEVRALEENAFAMGIPIIKLMENAGKAVYEEIINIPQAEKNSILIVAGYGNNGGDGLVTARLLVNEGYNCTLALIGDKNKFNSLSSRKNFERLIEILTDDNIIRIKDEKAFGKFKNNIKEYELIIDALLGIGISGTPKEPYKSVIDYLNSHFRGKIISIDTPSGYNPTSNNTIFISNPEKIVFLGKLEEKELNAWYQKVEAFVFPGLDEAGPIVILEAMKNRLPIISTKVGIVTEVVDEKNGYIVRPGSSADLKKRICDFLLLSTEQKKSMGEHSYAKVKKRFSWDKVADRFYQDLIRIASKSK